MTIGITEQTAHIAQTVEKLTSFLLHSMLLLSSIFIVIQLLRIIKREEGIDNKNRVVDNKQAQSSITTTPKVKITTKTLTLTVNESDQTQKLKEKNQELEQTLAKTREQLEKAQKEKVEQEENQRKNLMKEVMKVEAKYKKIWSFDKE